MIRRVLLSACIVLLGAASAHADIKNGDFSSGSVGWTTSVPAGWTVEFPASGGHPGGFAHLQSPFGRSGGTACVSQRFVCGQKEPGSSCMITLEYTHRSIDASPLTGRVKVSIDGTLVFTSAPSDLQDWTLLPLEVPCGEHTIDLCLEVDAGNNGWEAGFDNVTSDCFGATPAEPARWGTVKTLYR